MLSRNKKPCLEGAQSDSSAPGKQFDSGMAAPGARQLRCWLLRDLGCPITSTYRSKRRLLGSPAQSTMGSSGSSLARQPVQGVCALLPPLAEPVGPGKAAFTPPHALQSKARLQ